MSEAEKKELILAIESGKSTDWVYNGEDEQEVDTFDELEAIKEVEPLVKKYATSKVEAYKAALRREIEKYFNNAIKEPLHQYNGGLIDAYKTVLELLDTVEP